MKLGEQMNIDTLHHAYLLLGEQESVRAELFALLAEAGVATLGNPDFHEYVCDPFLLEHASTLRSEQSMQSMGAKKFFIISFTTMMHEAQNALLKTLEEPTAGTHFFFITRTEQSLLPTVRSRMQVVRNRAQKGSDAAKNADAKKFLSASLPVRMKTIEQFTKVKADEKGEAKESARVFLESLEHVLQSHLHTNASIASLLESVITAKRYLMDRAPSLKILLEHLALTLPKI